MGYLALFFVFCLFLIIYAWAATKRQVKDGSGEPFNDLDQEGNSRERAAGEQPENTKEESLNRP